LAFMTSAPRGFASLDEVANSIEAYRARRGRRGTSGGLRRIVRQRDDGRWYWHWDPAAIEGVDESTITERRRLLLTAANDVTVPVLVMRGGLSDIVSAEGIAELIRLIPHASVAEIPEADHTFAGDDNELFRLQISAWLDMHSTATCSE